MPKEWTGELVGLMHNHKISNKMVADALNMSEQYVSMILNGHREPPGAEERFKAALSELITQENHTTT